MAGWLRGELTTINDELARAVAAHGDSVFLDFSGELHSYAEVDQAANRLARGLATLGVAKGDTVASILDNNIDAVLVWLAINKLGAVSVPVNTAFKGEFLRHQLADSGAAVIVAESDYAARVIEIASGLPDVRQVLCRGDVSHGGSERFAMMPLDEMRADDAGPLETKVAPSDLAMLIYTAGTTGPSKGCMISHNYACNLARLSIKSNARTRDDIAWSPLPLFHFNAIATTVIAQMMVGGRAAIYPRFSLSNFWNDIERSGATIAAALGSMIPLIANAADTDTSKRCYGQLRAVRGAPFTAELQDTWRTRFGIASVGANVFGLTEASVVTSLTDGEYARPGSSGRRNDCFDVMIVDDGENELPPGQAGEIVVRPRKPHVMFEGYWHRPDDTLKLLGNLWFHTGDIGKFDDDGFFYFVDRKKDYLRRRGENISSFEMESTFRQHPAIEDVAVHGVKSSLTEEDVKVTAVLRAGAVLSEDDLCLWSIDRVPYFAVPRYIEFRNELPKNPVGRILKYQLRDEGATRTTWDREVSGREVPKR